jgi:RNA polymerase primary sigma factor
METKNNQKQLELFDRNRQLAEYFAKIFLRRYRDSGVVFEELKHFGEIGLWKAVRNYDPDKGEFQAYAKFWIYGEIIKNLIRENQFIHIPDWVSTKIKTVGKIEQSLEKKLKKEPTYEEISRVSGISKDEIETLLEIKKNVKSVESLDKPITAEGQMTLKDTVIHRGKEERELEHSQEAKELIDKMTNPDAQVMKMRFGIDCDRKYSRSEIAKALDISTDRVERIEHNRLRELRNMMGFDY